MGWVGLVAAVINKSIVIVIFSLTNNHQKTKVVQHVKRINIII